MRVLLPDTMVFSALLRGDVKVRDRIVRELTQASTLLVSPVVYYELRRGLLKRQALRSLAKLDLLLANLVWLELTRADWDAAADLWAATQNAGTPRDDADLLIAAQANRHRAIVITDNVRHFRNIATRMESWH